MDTKVMIGVPSASTVHVQALASVHNLIAATRSAVELRVVQRVGTPADRVRNQIVDEFLSCADYTHLLFVDSDVSFPADGLDRLLALDAPIAAGTYPMIGTRISSADGAARLNLSAVVGHYADARHREETPSPEARGIVYRWLDAHELGGRPRVCDGVGTGFCLIRRDVLETLTRPWFRVMVDVDDRVTTEDLYFARKAQRAGFSIVADTTVACDHFKRLDLSRLEELFTDAVPVWPWTDRPPEAPAQEAAEVMIATVGRDEWLNLRLADFLFTQLSSPAACVRKVSYNFGSDPVEVWNQAFEEFLEQSSCTHLLLVSDDVCPAADFLVRALAARTPFAAGCYRVVAGNDIQYEAGFIDSNGKVALLSDLQSWRREQPSEVDFVGLSATLIERRLVEKLERPICPPNQEPRAAAGAFCRRVRETSGVRPTLLPVPCHSFAEVGLKTLFDLKGQFQRERLVAEV